MLRWFETLEKEINRSKSKLGEDGWVVFWRRIKDRIRNDQINPPDGWVKLWKRLRAIDEEKVRDYKEDIDCPLILVRTAATFSSFVTITECLYGGIGRSIFRYRDRIPHRFLHLVTTGLPGYYGVSFISDLTPTQYRIPGYRPKSRCYTTLAPILPIPDLCRDYSCQCSLVYQPHLRTHHCVIRHSRQAVATRVHGRR